MKLNKEQQKKLLEKLQESWPAPKACSVCKHNEWDISDIIFELREFHGGNMVIGGKSNITPVVYATCRNCGNTLFFNALKLDLIEKNAEEPDKK
ncbi:hypothetical protein KKH39_01575 [Patescibacteria group bacterium]|nr:hypothetical protein [Patescibacteria group bacterium]